MSTFITQVEADKLMELGKFRENDDNHQFPDIGGSLEIPLVKEPIITKGLFT
ncbi:MAG: hypothetical protein HQL03_10445 [Nitrospirae bacterium]|nr:hypothetical protein [Nitrospirota bacterium]